LIKWPSFPPFLFLNDKFCNLKFNM
jgi:hypothetical protein